MKIPFEWQTISYRSGKTYHNSTCRAKVYGGWLVKNLFETNVITQTLVFVPDPEHLWQVEWEKPND